MKTIFSELERTSNVLNDLEITVQTLSEWCKIDKMKA